jgi:hypothetical protein
MLLKFKIGGCSVIIILILMLRTVRIYKDSNISTLHTKQRKHKPNLSRSKFNVSKLNSSIFVPTNSNDPSKSKSNFRRNCDVSPILEKISDN